MLAKPQGFPRKLGGCAGLDPRLRSAVSAGVGDGERGLRAPGVGVRRMWVLEYSPSNKTIRCLLSITGNTLAFGLPTDSTEEAFWWGWVSRSLPKVFDIGSWWVFNAN